ncbi:MAG: hypothetical protein BAJATHORv1_10619 [Candidatus Thorarchaeota archaeon]|nr:MAG: hypothetical protein BAJATHORv1_10619 [Candidatus Thorarchaeota archaeon]
MNETDILKVPTEKIEYPPICPVCNNESTSFSYIVLNPSSSGYERPRDIRFYPAERYTEQRVVTGIQKTAFVQGTPRIPKKYLEIPTCDSHEYSSIDDNRRVIFLFLLLVLLFTSIFLIFQFSNSYFLGSNWIPSLQGLIVVIVLMSIITSIVYYPPPLRRSFNILDISPDGSHIYLQLENNEYRSQFIDLNAIHIDYVSTKQMKKELGR